MAEPLSAAKQNLLLDVVNAQDRATDGMIEIFCGLRQSSDPEAASVSAVALGLLVRHKLVVIAMTEKLNATLH